MGFPSHLANLSHFSLWLGQFMGPYDVWGLGAYGEYGGKKSFLCLSFCLATHLVDLFVAFRQFGRLVLHFLVGLQVYEGSNTLMDKTLDSASSCIGIPGNVSERE